MRPPEAGLRREDESWPTAKLAMPIFQSNELRNVLFISFLSRLPYVPDYVTFIPQAAMESWSVPSVHVASGNMLKAKSVEGDLTFRSVRGAENSVGYTDEADKPRLTCVLHELMIE